ncbi:hypothetical protein SYNPS1DRAFT_29400 [Syncephalis pseudoplumigaleata]|uniref:Uncharacterized protein n=1 Tax=Syncephalis pseudoplumigaleata TaxID=1712513 RepID=A0A4P9YXK6_9FUNG|nr:hypothetical protein SYNPS1DRAFT_29400 [Syncephalis pseudoplumigaleata]|eukprot:RKP24853.1 hypothetical protein SYNPS1DRAFT_29400 [Syncephalis pseudoplumigaleata]
MQRLETGGDLGALELRVVVRPVEARPVHAMAAARVEVAQLQQPAAIPETGQYAAYRAATHVLALSEGEPLELRAADEQHVQGIARHARAIESDACDGVQCTRAQPSVEQMEQMRLVDAPREEHWRVLPAGMAPRALLQVGVVPERARGRHESIRQAIDDGHLHDGGKIEPYKYMQPDVLWYVDHPVARRHLAVRG